MNRRLMALNLLLVAALIYAGFQFHARRAENQAREAAVLRSKVAPVPPPAITPPPTPPAVTAATFAAVAQKDLFDKSRNPDVPIELPPPPPPPKDPPPLPYFHGMMNIGDGPIAIMSVANDDSQQAVHKGGMIGDFKLLDFNLKEVTLEWDNRVFHRRADDTDTAASAKPAAAAAAAAPMSVRVPGLASMSAAPAPAQTLRELGPGPDNGQKNRPCQLNDSSPDGAVADGFRKVSRATMFGNECHWEPVGK